MNTTLLILSFLLFGCEAKSLDLNSKVSENSVVDEIAKNSSKVTQKEIELEELKKDIGKVGNRLEGIVYEVLKDFFSKDFELNETQANNHSMKETESVTEILLKKYHPTFFENNENRSSVIDDEVIHTKSSGTTGSPIDQTATTFPDTTSTSTTPQIFENELAPTSSTQEVNTLQNTLNSMEPESISTTQVSNKDSTPETTEIPISTTSETIQIPHKLRKRRMALENPELSRSNENFIEPNPEPPRRSSNSRRKFQNPEEPIIPDFQIAETEKLNPEQPKRRNSKAKLEHFEGPIMTDLQGPESEYKPSLRLIERTPSHSDNPEIPKEPLSKRKSYEKEEIPEKKQKIEEIPEQRRKKKSRKDNNDSNNQRNVEGDNNMVGQSFGWSNQPTPICYEKNGREDLLEKQHIEDLKYEVNKLRSVVDLLREQQKLINSFDSGDKKVMNEQEMLDVLNQINNKKNPDPTDKNQANEIDVTEKAKHEDLARIKLQLQETIENLNRTKEILSLEHKKEMNLEEEMKNQKTEIGWLKLIIENFIIAQTKKRKEQSQEFKLIDTGNKTVNKTEDHIVRSRPPQSLASHHNHTIPSTVRMAEEKLKEVKAKSRSSDSSEFSRMRMNPQETRASELSKLEKLLDVISDKESKSDDDDLFQLKLLDAVNELRKKKEKEHSAKDFLKKLQSGNLESKSDDDDLTDLLKIQKALKALDSPQSKSDDLDVENQLKLLQREINKLRPNDLGLLPTESKAPGDDPVQFQAMLTKLIAANPQFQGTKLPPITPQQLIQLQKKFNTRPAFLAPGVPDVNSGSPAALLNGYGKLGFPYGPYSTSYGPYSSPSKYGPYGKDDYSPSIGSYGGGYQDYSKTLLYGGSGSNGYAGNNGYGSSPGYLGGGAYSGPTISSSYSSLAPYGASKVSYTGGLLPEYQSNFSPAPYKSNYAKPQEIGYTGNLYSSPPSTYASPNTYSGNNFFQAPQPSSYATSPPASYLPPKTFDAPGPDKLYPNQFTYATASSPYTNEKIDELKTQIYGLQNAINSYNRPEYTQSPEDRNAIYNLEQQIDELKNIVNTLNGYSGDPQGYSPSGAISYEPNGYNYQNPQTPDAYTRDSEKRTKRSIKTESKPTEDTKETKIRKKRAIEEESPGILDTITSAFSKAFTGYSNTEDVASRSRRSLEDSTVEERQASSVLDKLTSALTDVLEEDPETTSSKPNYLPFQIQNYRRNSPHQIPQPNSVTKHATLHDIRKQIDHLKKQLGHQHPKQDLPDLTNNVQIPIANELTPFSTRHALLSEPGYNYNYGQNGFKQFTSDLTLKPKKIEIFKSIVAKIMDKVLESLPVILQKLFGFAVHELTAYGDNYGYGSDYGLSIFRNLGIFGYIPIIIIRIVNAISTFVYILQKNKFLKYFLIPAGVVLLVAGSMVFLIWWMQPSDYYVNYEKSYDKDDSISYDNQYDYGKSSGPIIKTYGVDEARQARFNNPEMGTSLISPNNGAYPPFYKPNQMLNMPENKMPMYAQ